MLKGTNDNVHQFLFQLFTPEMSTAYTTGPGMIKTHFYLRTLDHFYFITVIDRLFMDVSM